MFRASAASAVRRTSAGRSSRLAASAPARSASKETSPPATARLNTSSRSSRAWAGRPALSSRAAQAKARDPSGRTADLKAFHAASASAWWFLGDTLRRASSAPSEPIRPNAMTAASRTRSSGSLTAALSTPTARASPSLPSASVAAQRTRTRSSACSPASTCMIGSTADASPMEPSASRKASRLSRYGSWLSIRARVGAASDAPSAARLAAAWSRTSVSASASAGRRLVTDCFSPSRPSASAAAARTPGDASYRSACAILPRAAVAFIWPRARTASSRTLASRSSTRIVTGSARPVN